MINTLPAVDYSSHNLFFYSYPRSGKEWQEIRMMLFFYHCFPDLYPNLNIKQLGEIVILRHFGYSQVVEGSAPTTIPAFPKPRSNISLIFREPKATLTSCFYYANFYMGVQRPEILDIRKTPREINEYVTGKYGVERLVSFLNNVNDLLILGDYPPIHMMYFEDAFNKQFIYNIPTICGYPRYSLSESEVEFIFRNSSADSIRARARGDYLSIIDRIDCDGINTYITGMIGNTKEGSGLRKGTIDSYKKDLTQQTQDYINDYIKRHCRLESYVERYFP